ncbi:hypothetical protein FRC02_005882 [Tulasnella sp. 418]|nr:hypothetical protein FRC02_005882 [Tulasnella sp. 418]
MYSTQGLHSGTTPNYSAVASTSSNVSNANLSNSESSSDPRTKNARAQARHRAKRKAYVEQLEATVHSLRAAVNLNMTSPTVAAKIQYLEEENARLRRESQALRARLESATGALQTPTSAYPSSAHLSGMNYNSERGQLELPMTGNPNYGAQSTQQPYYGSTEDHSLRGRYYESTYDYRRQVSPPPPSYSLSSSHTRESSHDSERVSNSNSRSSTRSGLEPKQEPSPTLPSPGYLFGSQQTFANTNPSFPPVSSTAGAYVFSAGAETRFS